jgi:transcriptional regulator with XRE-family HTH domain
MNAQGLIRRARKHAGLDLAGLAKLAGVGESSVSQIERKPYPSIQALERYGAVLGLELRVFYLTKDGKIID